MEPLFIKRSKPQRGKEKTLGGFATSRESILFSQKDKKPPYGGRLCVTFFVVWRAKAQRRKEIGEDLGTLPLVGMLYVNLFFIWRAKAQRRKEKPSLRLGGFAR